MLPADIHVYTGIKTKLNTFQSTVYGDSKQTKSSINSITAIDKFTECKNNKTKTFANYNLYTYEYMSENNFLILYSNIKNQSMSCYRP